jgi:hypothetical protein
MGVTIVAPLFYIYNLRLLEAVGPEDRLQDADDTMKMTRCGSICGSFSDILEINHD